MIGACVICYATMELIENTICRDKIFDPIGRKNRLEILNVIDIYGWTDTLLTFKALKHLLFSSDRLKIILKAEI